MSTFVMDPQRARLIQSDKMSAAGNLLAGIVHELNNPLTTILGFSELLLQEGTTSDPSRIAKIRAEAERSVKIIQNVLRLARADRGCGATFTLDLPIVIDGIAEDNDSSADDPNVLAPDRSVLVVDDEDYIGELVESVLQKCGYRTDRLNDGGPAIELMKTNDYDILICDLHMPGVGGRELIEWTRLNRQNMRVLLLSGDVARTDVSDFAKAYGIHFLSKPFSVGELTKAVQRLFS